MISLMVFFTLLTPFTYHIAHDSHISMTKNGQKIVENMFMALFAAITSYSNHNIVSWVND
jgi:hypothetical protein